jgi:hypothetical protein
MPHATVEFDERGHRVWLDDRLLDILPGKRADRVHGSPSCQHQKLDLVAEPAATELRAGKSRDVAQLGDDLLAEMLRVRARFAMNLRVRATRE